MFCKALDYLRWAMGWTPEGSSRRAIRKLKLEPGQLVLDCGANVGEMTEVLAANGSTVHAFEPNPHAFAVLNRKFAGRSNVHCHNAAVGTAHGHMPLYLHENSDSDEVLWSNGSSLLREKSNVAKDRFIKVEVIDLGDFILNLNSRIRIMKMDIEGAEVEVLQHLLASGAMDRVDCAFVETHEKKIPSLVEGTTKLKTAFLDHPTCNVSFDWV